MGTVYGNQFSQTYADNQGIQPGLELQRYWSSSRLRACRVQMGVPSHIPWSSSWTALSVLAQVAQASSRPCMLFSLSLTLKMNYTAGICTTQGWPRDHFFVAMVVDEGWAFMYLYMRLLRVGNRVWGWEEKGVRRHKRLYFNSHRNWRILKESSSSISFSLEYINFQTNLVVLHTLKHSSLSFINKNALYLCDNFTKWASFHVYRIPRA